MPYQLFIQEGFIVETASVKGGTAPIDPPSNPTEEQSEQWMQAIDSLQPTSKLSEVSPDDYDVVFFPGGHGTMFDLPNNPNINSVLQHFYENNKNIVAVCHGPACFVGATIKKWKIITGWAFYYRIYERGRNSG
ncbi:DJ-1/PfpI family protein [Abyssogena phaseoliformis symbiont]|uniref:DJ-1/PfpI family protein n=1 Tax=Abyssogena phaseoliformis symbiont TaxID=596095 RepID=UPI0019153E70|nr:DJ-1/PfpI family protein [Abyssogena phaseoliformis symbiont]